MAAHRLCVGPIVRLSPKSIADWSGRPLTDRYGADSVEIDFIDCGSGGEEHREDNQTILDQLERTVPPPTNFGDGAEVENIWNEQLELVIIGQQDVETAVQTIVESINPILQEE